jgi:hypothetical protein
MTKTPNYDAKVSQILAETKPGERVCALTGEKWMMTDEEIGWYKKFNVPPAKVSPQTRWYQHGLWFVGYQFWYQPHPETGKPVVCTVHPATGIKVLPDQEWFQKDFSDQGMDYDAARPFFPQWRDLELAVPFPASRNHLEPKNSITFVSQGDEDSYFVGASKTKHAFYCHGAQDTEDSAEVYQSFFVQNSFHVVHSHRIFQCRFVQECADCLESAFLFDCRNCEFCFGATNQRNKKYLWFNKQLTKEAWEEQWRQMDWGSRKTQEENLQKFKHLIETEAVWPENFNNQAVHSTGEYLNKVSNIRESYFCDAGSADAFKCQWSIGDSRWNAFSGYTVFSSDCYLCGSVTRSSQCRFCFLNIQCRNTEYCLLCYNCEDCFGCVGLQRKKFHVMNKPYTEEEYWRRVDELKCAMLDRGEYGAFFPVAFSPSYHGDSFAFCLGITEVEKKKMHILDFDPETQGAIGQDLIDTDRIRPAVSLPDHVRDLTDEWAGIPLLDEEAHRRYALLKPEIEFYRRFAVAPPTKHFVSRIKNLWREANQGNFYDARCAKCDRPIRVARNAAHPKRTIFCEKDYLRFLEERA